MSVNQFKKCEEALGKVAKAGDLLTSSLLQELAEVGLANASAYLRCQEKHGRFEFVGKTISDRGRKHLCVYKVKEEFFFLPSHCRNEKYSGNKNGGVKGRTWEVKEAPLIFL